MLLRDVSADMQDQENSYIERMDLARLAALRKIGPGDKKIYEERRKSVNDLKWNKDANFRGKFKEGSRNPVAVKKGGVSFEDDSGGWSEDPSDDRTDVDDEDEGDRDTRGEESSVDTPATNDTLAIRSAQKSATKKSTMNPNSTSIYSKIDKLEVDAGMLKTNEKVHNKNIEDLVLQVHQLTAQINGSIEFPPEDEIDMIMRYQSNFQQGGYQNRGFQNNNNFGGMRSNSPMTFNSPGRTPFTPKCYLCGMKISEEGHEMRGQCPFFNEDGKMNTEKIADIPVKDAERARQIVESSIRFGMLGKESRDNNAKTQVDKLMTEIALTRTPIK